MKNNKNKVTYNLEYNRFKIYINNLLYISIPYELNSDTRIHSWYEHKTCYKIEIYCRGYCDYYEFDNYEIWSSVLKILDTIF